MNGVRRVLRGFFLWLLVVLNLARERAPDVRSNAKHRAGTVFCVADEHVIPVGGYLDAFSPAIGAIGRLTPFQICVFHRSSIARMKSADSAHGIAAPSIRSKAHVALPTRGGATLVTSSRVARHTVTASSRVAR